LTLLRGSHDFETLADYQQWLEQAIVAKLNRRVSLLVEAERAHLRALPVRRTRDYSEVVVPVTTSSMITVRCVMYTVPSRLIGERLRVHIYDDRLRAFVGSTVAHEMPRVYPLPGKRRARRVDYRDVIESLVKKPRAFRSSIYRDELLPNATYRRAYAHFTAHLSSDAACKLIVGAPGGRGTQRLRGGPGRLPRGGPRQGSRSIAAGPRTTLRTGAQASA
jgi:hypothetical protein